jgi:diadenosine tetraphosphate (Ap4A) HIT family hydrolase
MTGTGTVYDARVAAASTAEDLQRGGNRIGWCMSFTLHPRLEAGSFELGELLGCRVLLKNNAVFPWLLIVPEVDEGIEDLHQLDADRYGDVAIAIRMVSQFVAGHFSPEKLNVACIGNQVRQMHIHVVGRSTGDPAWPGVVWSCDAKKAYRSSEVETIRAAWELHAG